MNKEKKPALWKVWWIACRPHTLTASISPVIVSYNVGFQTLFAPSSYRYSTHFGNDNLSSLKLESSLSQTERDYYFWLTMKWALFCILIQLGTNLHNDYSDFVQGADTDKRVGQARATQKGWLTPFQTAMGASMVLLLALLIGIVLISGLKDTFAIWTMSSIVSTSIFNAFAYTGGPWPLGYIGLGSFSIGYLGLGDFFVFLYFGLVATMTPPFLYISLIDNSEMKRLMAPLMLKFCPYAIQTAALATNIIVVNNLRDRYTDVNANKRTLAVRFGADFCRIEYAVMVSIAYGFLLLDFLFQNNFAFLRLLPLLSFPLAYKELRAVLEKDGAALNPHVGGSAKVQFLFSILLATGIRLSN